MGDSSDRRAACGRYDPQPWRKDRCRVCFRTREDHGLGSDDVDGGGNLMPLELAGSPEGGTAAEIAEQNPSQLPPFMENRSAECDPSGAMLLSPEGSSVGDPEEDQASTDLETSSAEENGSTERIDKRMGKEAGAPPPRVKPRSGAHSSKPWRQNSASSHRKKLRTADEVMVKPGDVTKKLSKGSHIGKPSAVRGNFERGGGLGLANTYTRSSLTKSPAVYRKETGARTLNTDSAGKGTTVGIWSSGGKQHAWHSGGSVKAKPDGKQAGDGIYLTERYRAKARAQASRGTRGSDEKLNNYLRSPDSDRGGTSTSPEGDRRSPNSPEDRNVKVGDDVAEENSRLKAEIKELKLELEEMQDSFREEEFEQFRQLQRELEQTSRNCRILQLRLRKAEKRNEQVEADRGNYSRVREIEQDLKVAKDVSVRLHHELEQVEEKRSRVEEQNQHLRHKLVKSETSRQALKGEVEKLRKQVQKAKTHNKGSDTEDASSAVSQATSAEAQSDVRRQLELVEEETNLMRQSLVEVEKDRDGLQFQLEQYKRKYGEFESSESEQAEQSESSNISKEAQLKLKLKLVEEEATTLGRKLIEMEVKNEKLGVELQKYRGRCKNMSASSSESEASYPESDMPENVEELRRQLQFLEEEADVLRRTVSDLEEQNHNLTAQVSRYQAEKKAGNLRPRGKDGGHDLKAKLRLLEEDNSISKQKLAAMEYDNRILVSTIQKYELEIKCAKSARTPDSGSKEDINKKQLEEEVTFLRNKLADMEGRNEDLARICAGNEQDMAAARQEKDVEKQISEFQRLEEMCLLEQNIEELQTHLEYLQTCLDRKDDVCKRQEKELTVMSEELRILKTEAGLKTDGEEFRWRKQPARDDIASAITPPSDDKKKSKSSKDGSPTKKTSTRSRGLKDMIAQDKTKTILHDASEDLNCETNGDSGIVEQHGGRSRLDMTSSGTATSPMGLTVVVDPDLKQVPLSGGKLQMLQEKLAKIEETRKLLLDCSAQTSDLRDKNGGLTEESPDWSAVLHVVDELQHHFDRLQKVCTDYGLLLRETQEQNSQMDDRQGEIDTLLQSLYDHCATISTNSSSLREHMTSLKTLLNRSDDNINNTPAALEIHAENSTEEPKLLQKYNQAYSSLQNLMQGVEDTVDCFVQPARERDGIAFRESATLRECGENSKLMAPTKGPETEPEQDTSGIARCKNVPQSPALQNDDRENGVSSKACVCQNRTECSQNHTVEAHKITSISGDGCEAVEDQTDTAAAAGTFKIVGGSSEESQHLETISSPNSAQEEAESPAHSFITPTVEVYPCERLDLVHLFAENLKLQDELEVREIEWTVQNFQLSYELDRLRELCTTIAQLAFSDTLVSATIPYQKDSPGGASLMEETLQEGRIADAEMKKILETLMTQVSGDLETNKDRNCKTSSDVTSPKDQTRADTSGKTAAPCRQSHQPPEHRGATRKQADRVEASGEGQSGTDGHDFMDMSEKGSLEIDNRLKEGLDDEEKEEDERKDAMDIDQTNTNGLYGGQDKNAWLKEKRELERKAREVDESRGLLSEFRGLLEDLRGQLKNEEKRKKDIHDLYMAEKSAWDNEKQRLEERIKVVETKATEPQHGQKQNKMADLLDPDMERCQSAPPGDPYVYRTELVRKWEEEKKSLMHMFEEERNQWQEQLSSMQSKIHEFQVLRPFSPVFDDPVPKRKQLDSSGLTQAQKHNANTEEILRWEIEKRQLKRTLDEALRQIASVTDDLSTYKVSGIGPLKRSKSQSDLRSLQELDSAMETLYHTSGASSGSGYTASYSSRHPDVTSAQTLCSSSNQNRGYYRYATEVPYRGRVDDVSGPPIPPRSTSFRATTEGFGEVKTAQKPADRKPKKYSKRSHTAPIPDRREVNGKLKGDDLMHPSQFKALKQLFEARTQSHGLKPMNFVNGATGPYAVVPKRSSGTGREEEHARGRIQLRKYEQIRDAPSPVPILPGSTIVPVGAVPVLGIPVRGLSKLVREKEAMKAQAERDERNARMEMKDSPSVSLDSPTDRSTTSEETSATQELLDEILLRRSDDQRTPSPASDRSSPKLVAQNVRVVCPERGPPSTEPFVPKSASSGPYDNVASWLGQSRIQNISLAHHDPPLHSEPPLKLFSSEADTYSRHSPSLMDTYGNSDIASRPLGRHQSHDTQSYLQMDRSKSVDSHLSRGRRGADDFAARLVESRTKTERIEEYPLRREEGMVKSLTFPEERMVERSKSAPPTRHLELRLDEPSRLTSKPPRPVYPDRLRRSPSPPGTPSRLTPDPERSMSPVSPNVSRRRFAGEVSSDSITFPDGGTLATRKLTAAEERYREGNRLARAAASEDSGGSASASFGRDTYPARSRQEQMRYQIHRETGIPALDRRLASMRQLLHTEDLEDILTPSYQRYKSNEQHLSSYRREEHRSVGTASSADTSSSRSKEVKQPKKKTENTSSVTSRVRSSSETVRLNPAPRLDAKFSRPQPANRRLPSRWSQVQDHPMADKNTNQNATTASNVHVASSSPSAQAPLRLPSRGEWKNINETAV
ncbi:rootletin-like isoform X2 [Branchiostoma lanceolatum]|uniref:rootletin-like isoform X2 n=1 Tax=Branchiostoma lanceolatum TaxID=7740 RepID=UPI00345232A4